MKIYIFIIFLFLVSFSIVIIFCEYEEYLKYYGTYDDQNLLVLIEKENISHITNELIINDKKTVCEIVDISDNYVINTDYKLYYEVKYKCDIDKYSLNSYVLDLKISKGNTTILKKIKNYF